MTTQSDRFATDKNGLVITPLESEVDRAAAFLEAFPLPARGGTFVDKSGHPLTISPSWVRGLDRYAAEELRVAASAIAAPDEIRQLWKRGADSAPMLTRRYLVEGLALDVAVDINRAGWTFATSADPGFELDELRTGELVWSDPSQSRRSAR